MDLATQPRPTLRVKLNELARTGSHGAELCVEACVSTGVKAHDEVTHTKKQFFKKIICLRVRLSYNLVRKDAVKIMALDFKTKYKTEVPSCRET